MSLTIPRTKNSSGIPWNNRYQYATAVAGVACLSYLLLYFIGFVPSDFRYNATNNRANTSATYSTSTAVADLSSAVPQGEQARRISIDKIGVDTSISHPVTTDIQTLNNYLSQGAVRWPGSGDPGHGNMFLFGHSSSLSNVINQAYKAFNGLGELENGDTIRVETTSGTYRYSVIDVEFRENSAVYVPFDTGEDMLTLSTCNNFGAKEDRIVVRALFTGYSPHR